MSYSNWVSGDDRRLIRDAMKTPMLSREEEHDLAQRWRAEGDEKALHKLTSAYIRLVVAATSRFRHYGLPVADLIQEGTVGLMEAAYRFEPAREVRFSTYASWWIRAAIQDFVLRNWSIVRTGTTAAHKALFFNLKRLKSKLGLNSDKPLGLEGRTRIAQEMGVRLSDVEAMEGRLSGVDRSLNAPVAEESDQEWQELLVSDAPLPEDVVVKQRDGARQIELIRQAMSVLTERESFIIQERRLSEDPVTLASLGDRLGISKERVRQLEAQALGKMKKALIKHVGDPIKAGLAPAA
ncbi:RNA polymerase factor sigma-32 [Yunchengibacter salinarum]|uniref:RNA polymerase factor sigma-32 n=1 Tax=Yunchengibacter salinarum TaxID=3133399 RepID=UPI0035B66A33